MGMRANSDNIWHSADCEPPAAAGSTTTLDRLTPFALRARRKITHVLRDANSVQRLTTRLDSNMCRQWCKSKFRAANGFPEILIETTSHCNYRCPFCPQGRTPRPEAYMTDAFFQRIIDELADMKYRGMVALNVNNEPLTHPHIVDFARLVSEKLPACEPLIITNGSLLTEEMFKAFLSMNNPPRLKINDYTRGHKVLARVRDYLKHLPPHLRDTDHVRLHKRSFDESMNNRAGNIPGATPKGHERQLMCMLPFRELLIAADGTVPLCCSDYRYEAVMGDARTQSLMEIWTGEPFAAVRRGLMESGRGAVPLCRNCTHLDLDPFDEP